MEENFEGQNSNLLKLQDQDEINPIFGGQKKNVIYPNFKITFILFHFFSFLHKQLLPQEL